jgi:hypothetical protein
LEERRQNEKELFDLQQRYAKISALTAGQEKIAEAHRAILEHRPFKQRLLEQATAFLVGVLASLVATIIWYFTKARPVTSAEAERLRRDELD